MKDPADEFIEQSRREAAERLQATYDEYQRNLHAMQTGVAYEQSNGSTDGSPKHLRVGVNAAMIHEAAIVGLLVAKGIFTEQEFAESLVNESRKEVDRYEKRLSERYGGAKISLG